MTEQEYIEATDLEMARVILAITRQMGCYDEPTKSAREAIKAQARSMCDYLGPIVSENMD